MRWVLTTTVPPCEDDVRVAHSNDGAGDLGRDLDVRDHAASPLRHAVHLGEFAIAALYLGKRAEYPGREQSALPAYADYENVSFHFLPSFIAPKRHTLAQSPHPTHREALIFAEPSACFSMAGHPRRKHIPHFLQSSTVQAGG